MESIPKPLFRRLILTFLVGTGCLFVGITFYFMENDIHFLSLSILVFFCSIVKTVMLYFQIIHKTYILMEGFCQSIRPLLFQKCNEITLEDMEGNRLQLFLGKNQKLQPGMYYHIYFKSSSGISPGRNPLMEKALLTDNLLGVELAEPPTTTSGTISHS